MILSPLLSIQVINNLNQYAGEFLHKGKLSESGSPLSHHFSIFNITGHVHVLMSSETLPCVASIILTLDCIVDWLPRGNSV